jgi:hypothetical protein
MPDENKTVDIDTSGPDIDVELETSTPETEVSIPEEKETIREASTSTQETSNEKQETKTEETEDTEGKEDQKDELEVYSKDVQRRIAKLTKKWREAERQKEEAITYARAQKQQADSISKKYSSLETSSVKEREARIVSGLQAAQAKLAAARESQDLSSEVEAQKEIARLGYEEARLLDMKQIAEARAVQQPTTMADVNIPQQPANSFNPDPKAEDWGSKNRWFGTDKPMTYTAFDIHETLVNDEGFDPSSDDYYSELDKRIRVAFPNKFVNNEDKAQNNTTKPTQQVASARRSVNPGRKTVRLTPSQVAIAKKLGVPLEEYAKQIKIMKEV